MYEWGVAPRQGQFIMIAGKSGSQKSGFALFLVEQMGLPTLYLAGDMTPQEVAVRLASMRTGETSEQVEKQVEMGNEGRYIGSLAVSPISFSFGSPIKWWQIDNELNAWVEVHDSYPAILVVDNLMDIEGCDTGYDEQSQAMQELKSLSRRTGMTIIVLHHATDKSLRAQQWPYRPSPRGEIKNGLSENPQLILSVALEPQSKEFRVACVKQRSGRQDLSAEDHITLWAEPELTRFHPKPTDLTERIVNG